MFVAKELVWKLRGRIRSTSQSKPTLKKRFFDMNVKIKFAIPADCQAILAIRISFSQNQKNNLYPPRTYSFAGFSFTAFHPRECTKVHRVLAGFTLLTSPCYTHPNGVSFSIIALYTGYFGGAPYRLYFATTNSSGSWRRARRQLQLWFSHPTWF